MAELLDESGVIRVGMRPPWPLLHPDCRVRQQSPVRWDLRRKWSSIRFIDL